MSWLFATFLVKAVSAAVGAERQPQQGSSYRRDRITSQEMRPQVKHVETQRQSHDDSPDLRSAAGVGPEAQVKRSVGGAARNGGSVENVSVCNIHAPEKQRAVNLG